MKARRSVAVSLVLLGSLLALVGCGDDDSSGTPDAGIGDAGSEPEDAGTDAGPQWSPPTDCDATDVDIYEPPLGVPEFTSADRGRVVTCGSGDPISAETIDTRARERDYDGPTLTSGVTTTRVLYQVERRSGEGGYSTGVLYMPDGGVTGAPLIVYVPPTTGLADHCAPSTGARFTDFERGLYALIGSGTPVFVPDLVGLGTPGTPAWVEPIDAGRATLDGARAALAVAPEGSLSGEVVLSGHSAGGHAALAAQGAQRTYAPDLDLLGVAAIAPVYLDASLFALLLGMADYATTDENSGWNVVYGAMFFVGHSAAYDGEATAWNPIAAGVRDQVRDVFETRCLENFDGGPDLRTSLAEVAPTVAALFDPGFRTSVNQCYWGACDDTGTAWQMRWQANLPVLDPEGAPIWFHHGAMDARILLADVNCPIRRAMAADERVQVCVYADATHNDVPAYVAPWIVEWTGALAGETAPPACPDPTPLPDASCGL